MKRESKKLTKKQAVNDLTLVTEWLEFILAKIKIGEPVKDHDVQTAERVILNYGIRGTQWLDILKKQ